MPDEYGDPIPSDYIVRQLRRIADALEDIAEKLSPPPTPDPPPTTAG